MDHQRGFCFQIPLSTSEDGMPRCVKCAEKANLSLSGKEMTITEDRKLRWDRW